MTRSGKRYSHSQSKERESDEKNNEIPKMNDRSYTEVEGNELNAFFFFCIIYFGHKLV